jgi:hypothetical protein
MSSASTVANYGGRIQPQGNIKQFVIGLGQNLQWTYQIQSTNNLKVQTTTDQSTPVYFNSDLYVGGNIYNTSDANAKNNIVSISKNKTTNVLNLNPVEFNYKSDINTPKRVHYGFIAQDIEKVYPELVKSCVLGYKNVNYIELIPLLLSKMKEMQNEIDELKQKTQELRDDIR